MVSASGMCLWKASANAGMRDCFGIVQLSGKPGEKPREKRGSTVRPAREGRKPGGSGIVCFPFS